MSRLPILPRWVLPPTMPSVYESESATVLEMTAKVYGALREVIEDYNKFVDGINKEIETFTGSTAAEIREFKEDVNSRLHCKFEDLDANLHKIRLDMKRYTDETLEKAFYMFGVVVEVTGEDIILSDASDEEIRALSIYGKTTQDWIPKYPEYPSELESAGDAGSVSVMITNGKEEQVLTVATPEGLPGIPVSEGGNYTDTTGQSWVCDEIDMSRGVYIRRINRINLADLSGWRHDAGWENANAFFTTEIPEDIKAVTGFFTIADIMCNRLKANTPNTISKKTGAAIGQSGIGVYVSLPEVETAEDLVSYFVKNETVLQYIKKTPEERPLTVAEIEAYKKLHTYMPNSEVTTDTGKGNTGAGIRLGYAGIMQNFVKNVIPDYTAKAVNREIRAGNIAVCVEYDPENEEINIIAGGDHNV